ncbi:MAG: hypothetical protein K2Q26_05475 [Bdellovibrionales bacterium]|nr:hypothetical protein [Bdellovibrionales bacterium]
MKIFGVLALIIVFVTTLSCAQTSQLEMPADPLPERREIPLSSGEVKAIEYRVQSKCLMLGRAALTPSDEVILTFDNSCGAISKTGPLWHGYGLILQAVRRDFPLEKLKTMTFLNHSSIGSVDWGPTLAGAAVKSESWTSYSKGEKASRAFTGLFNENQLGAEVRLLIKDWPLEIQLDKVEKIYQERGKKMPFAAQKGELFASRLLLPYTASVFIFTAHKPLIKSTN